MAKAKAKAKTKAAPPAAEAPAEAPVEEVEETSPEPEPVKSPATTSTSAKKNEVFRAPFETDVDRHIADFVAEHNISDYKITEVIGHVEAADNYWQKTIEY